MTGTKPPGVHSLAMCNTEVTGMIGTGSALGITVKQLAFVSSPHTANVLSVCQQT